MRNLVENFLDSIYQETFLNIIICEAKIKYYRLKQKNICCYLLSTIKYLNILKADLKTQITADLLIKASDIMDYFIFSLLKLVLKSNGK